MPFLVLIAVKGYSIFAERLDLSCGVKWCDSVTK